MRNRSPMPLDAQVVMPPVIGDSTAATSTFHPQAFLLHRVLTVLSLFPLPVLHALGTTLGWALWLIPNRRRRVARVNLTLCFPELTEAAHRRLLRRTLVEFGKSLVELARLWTGNAATIRGLVKEVVGEHELREALKHDKGVILAIPHLGAWELVGLYCGMGYDFTALYRSPRVAELDALMRGARERLGSQLVPGDLGGLRALHRVLHRGGIVGILPDQVPNEDRTAVYADFFGITAKTMVLLSRLSQRTGAPVVFACAERLSRGRGYRLWFNRGPCDIESGDLPASVASLNREVERHARLAPAQYQWCYKRFRQRQLGKVSFYRTRRTVARHA